MHLYKTTKGIVLLHEAHAFLLSGTWDAIVNQRNLYQHLLNLASHAERIATHGAWIADHLEAPIGSQEIWAAGVTYLRSRDARMEESQQSGGADFYQKVYEADRPELFFKSQPYRVAAHGQTVNIRKDSTWNVPEPELTLYINSFGDIQGYTIGNDMSSRSIEGENPLYLPQAKTYERSAAIGPCLYVPAEPIAPGTSISIAIHRAGKEMFANQIRLDRMKRTLPELAGYLFRGLHFTSGCYLMTGTGIVPGDDFTLAVHDEVTISIEGIGTLHNIVAEL